MKNFNWEDFKAGKTVINCKTEELAKDFLSRCHDEGIKWRSNDEIKPERSIWYWAKEDTCYTMEYSHSPDNIKQSVLVYGATDNYRGDSYEIIEWEIEEEKEVEDTKRFKLGDMEEGKEYKAYHNDALLGSYFKRDYKLVLRNGVGEIVETNSRIFDILDWEFEEVEKKDSGWFDDTINKESAYWSIGNLGQVFPTRFEGCRFDIKSIDYGNAFTTKEKAEKELERRKLSNMMQKFADENNTTDIDWNDGRQRKYEIYFNYNFDEYNINIAKSCETIGATYFISEEIAQRCINEVIKPFTNKQ
ncbi:MAG: hypothetical protein RSC24_06480 [Clostridium sp.]